MPLSAVSVLVVVRQSAEIPEGLMNYPVFHCRLFPATSNVGGSRVCASDTCPGLHSLLFMIRLTNTLTLLTHCGRVKQICVFNTVKLGTSASSP